ncbi:MAG: hypothetical protein AAFU65_17460, partial [Pseudomonadota bacterium]
TPVAINDAGQIVGITTRATGNGTFLWDSVNGLQDIPGVPGPQDTLPADINNGGVIVGATSGSTNSAVLWVPPSGPYGILPMPAGTTGSGAGAISNNNLVLGFAVPTADPFAFDLNAGGPALPVVDPAGLLGLATADDANDAGTIVGATDGIVAYRLAPGTAAQALGSLPGHAQSIATAVNDLGHVIGNSAPVLGNAPTSGFFWPGSGALQDLGTLRATDNEVTALGMNDADQVVGTSGAAGLGFRAFLWDPVNGIRDLNDLIDPTDPLGQTVTLFAGVDINDSGQIIATGFFNGLGQTFLLNPVTAGPPAPAVAVDFSGPLIALTDTSGGAATFAGAALDDVFTGQVIVGASETGSAFVPPTGYYFPSETFFANADDGNTGVSTQGSARSMEISSV